MEQNLWLAAHHFSFWYWKFGGTVKKTTLYLNLCELPRTTIYILDINYAPPSNMNLITLLLIMSVNSIICLLCWRHVYAGDCQHLILLLPCGEGHQYHPIYRHHPLYPVFPLSTTSYILYAFQIYIFMHVNGSQYVYSPPRPLSREPLLLTSRSKSPWHSWPSWSAPKS